MAAIVKPAGDLTAGVQVKGAVKQYGYSGQNDSSANLETITPYDSGTILGHVQPGGSGEPLVRGVVQRAQAALLCDGSASVVGNALTSIYNQVGSGVTTHDGTPAKPAGCSSADGLSLDQNHE